MCKEPEVPRRKMPFHNRLFDSVMPLIFLRRSTFTVGTLQLKWYSMEDAIVSTAVLHLRCQSFWDKSVPPPQAIVFSIEEWGTLSLSGQASYYYSVLQIHTLSSVEYQPSESTWMPSIVRLFPSYHYSQLVIPVYSNLPLCCLEMMGTTAQAFSELSWSLHTFLLIKAKLLASSCKTGS